MTVLVILAPLLALGIAACWWFLAQCGGPCDGCGQPLLDCRCHGTVDPTALLAADAPAERVAASAYTADVARGYAETPDQWATRIEGGAR